MPTPDSACVNESSLVNVTVVPSATRSTVGRKHAPSSFTVTPRPCVAAVWQPPPACAGGAHHVAPAVTNMITSTATRVLKSVTRRPTPGGSAGRALVLLVGLEELVAQPPPGQGLALCG